MSFETIKIDILFLKKSIHTSVISDPNPIPKVLDGLQESLASINNGNLEVVGNVIEVNESQYLSKNILASMSSIAAFVLMKI